MTETRSKGPLIDPGKCRCCGETKKCRVLNAQYTHKGQKEVYSDMMFDCFGLLLSNLDGSNLDRLVCAMCVTRLREAFVFRNQVLKCEEMLLKCFQVDVVKMETDPDDNVHSEDFTHYTADDLYTPETKEENVHKPISKTSNKINNRDITQTKMRKELLNHMKQLKTTVKEENKPVKVIKEKHRIKKLKSPTPPPLITQMGEEDMVCENTLTILENSYVCPFNNKKNYYYCFYCKSIFLDPDALRLHTINHDPILFERFWTKKRIPKIDITRIDCRLCDAKVDNLKNFRTHITTEHNKKMHPIENEFFAFRLTQTDIPCLECNKTFLFIDKLLDHMTVHFGKYICDVCGNNFLQLDTLKAHLQWHKKTDEDFPCHICGKILKSNYTRNFHIQVVHKKTASIECFKCEEKFLSYQRRNRHLVDIHGEIASFTCNICAKSFETRRKYGVHFRRYHNRDVEKKRIKRTTGMLDT